MSLNTSSDFWQAVESAEERSCCVGGFWYMTNYIDQTAKILKDKKLSLRASILVIGGISVALWSGIIAFLLWAA